MSTKDASKESVDQRVGNRTVLEAFFDAVGEADFDRLALICTPDFVVEFPYTDPPSRLEGFEAYRAGAGAALDTFRFRLELDRVHTGANSETLVAEYRSDGVAIPTGKPYRNVYVGVFEFRGGRLAALREYWNPLIAAEALEPD
jgi:ketosteroid isomerase-like protein